MSVVAKQCTLLFLRQDDKVLLAMKKRGFGADRFNGVGGKVEAGETLEQALIRECQEEISVTPTRFYKVAEHNFIQQEESSNPWHMHVHVFLCDEWQGQPQESEEMAPEWFSIRDIPYDRMWQDDIHWVPQILAGQHVRGTFTFDANDTMLTHSIEKAHFG